MMDDEHMELQHSHVKEGDTPLLLKKVSFSKWATLFAKKMFRAFSEKASFIYKEERKRHGLLKLWAMIIPAVCFLLVALLSLMRYGPEAMLRFAWPSMIMHPPEESEKNSENDIEYNVEAFTTTDVSRLREKAETGDPRASYEIARNVFSPDRHVVFRMTVPVADAYHYLRVAVSKNHPGAQLVYAELLLQRRPSSGIDIEHSLMQGIKYLAKSVAQKNPHAAEILGEHYWFGNGVKRDYERAFRLFSEAEEETEDSAESGVLLNMMGICYDSGRGVEQDDKKAFDYYRRSASKGNIGGQLNLAGHYYFGIGIGENRAESFRLYSEAVNVDKNGHILFMLGVHYEFGEGVGQDAKKAFDYYKQSAEMGYVGGVIGLAGCYYSGIGTEKNHAESFRLYNKAASVDKSGQALYVLGQHYEFGEGIGQDDKKAFDYYKQSAEKGHVGGMLNLACFYYFGIGTEQDYPESFRRYSEAMNMDESGYALYMLGQHYEFGFGIGQDDKKAFDHYKQSAEKSHVGGMLNLARCYYFGIGTEQDYPEAFKLYNEVANVDESGNALCMLGVHYEFGEGVGQDAKKAFGYYQQSVEKGSVHGMLNLARCYYFGIGTEQDYPEAFKLYNEVANVDESGNAQYMLGQHYEFGLGIEQDVKKAFDHYKQSAEKGSVDGMLRLADCYYSGIGTEQDYPEAFRQYNEAINLDGIGYALCMLGQHYEFGRGVEQDAKKAFDYYKQSADEGNVSGLLSLAECYSRGIGTGKDRAESFRQYSAAVDADDSGEALFALGLHYEFGEGVGEDGGKALKLYKQAADKGYDGGLSRTLFLH